MGRPATDADCAAEVLGDGAFVHAPLLLVDAQAATGMQTCAHKKAIDDLTTALNVASTYITAVRDLRVALSSTDERLLEQASYCLSQLETCSSKWSGTIPTEILGECVGVRVCVCVCVRVCACVSECVCVCVSE